ncbi:MAG: PHP domain-containing protein, partial [Sarcina sp.]
MNYENYHSHKMFTNTLVPDSPAKYEDYINRAIELGQTVITSVEHGFQGNYWLLNEMIRKKNVEFENRRRKGEKNVPKNLHFIFGTEAYWVKDRHEKDKSNCHMIILAKNENGRRKINLALSIANEDGVFNGRPRLDLDLIFSLPKDDVFITTACLAYWNKYEDIKELTEKFHNHFGDNFMIEMQPHNTPEQIELNNKILEIAKELNIKLIAGVDSHYINDNPGNIMRDKILEYKGIRYEDEEGWFLDYPSCEELIKRFEEQGILNEKEINEAIENTNIINTFDDIDLGLKTIEDKDGNLILDAEIKLPTLYEDMSQEEKDKLFKHIINEEWKKFRDRENIDEKDYPMYLDGIRYEVNEVITTGMTDYFLLHYVGLKKGVDDFGGIITKRGRGCFTKDAMIVTKDTLKPLNEMKIGDEVISDDGKWHKVVDKFEYDIEEEMIEFEYQCQGSSYKKYKNICTLDHKILVYREGREIYLPADDMEVGDLLCSPKIKLDNAINENKIIDLNNYNTFGYKYDENYIYEEVSGGKEYLYSTKWLSRHGIVSSSFAQKIGQGKVLESSTNKKTQRHIKKLLDNTPFKTIENYKRYINKHGKTYRKIPRYLKLDYVWNLFIGMMYGDGWTNKDQGLGFAISSGKKTNYNKYVFNKIAERLGLPVYINEAKNRDLSQLFINSKIMYSWFMTDFFKSKKGVLKRFNIELLEQSKNNLKALYNGLFRTDGSRNIKENKMCFDNTSLSLINAFRNLNNILGNEPLAFDVRLGRVDNRNYVNKESYKVRKPIKRKKNLIEDTDKYFLLPVTKIIKKEKIKNKVYDLTVEGNHSYTINNIIVHNSGVGYFINTLLGFSKVDRFKAPIKLYPERFLTSDRILKSKSLPDIDNNIAKQEPFEKAFKELLGENSIYPMLAFGSLKKSSAIKLYMGAEGIEASIQNEVSKQLKEYDKAIKHCETDEEKEAINIENYISKEYSKYIGLSKPYQGIVIQKSPHPCAFLLFNGDIREEIGLFRCTSESTKKSVLTACIEGAMADHYKYLKTDLLVVDVVGLTEAIWKRINKPSPTNNELERLLHSKEGEKAWDMYAKGYTLCINQCEKEGTKNKCKKYKMKSTAELSAFVAAIRPAFGSLINNFLNRNEYTTGVEKLDGVLKDSYHYMLYQESLMAYLNWLGIDMKETYDIVKKISKKVFEKHPEQMEELKNKCRPRWIENVGTEDGFEETWKVMNDAGSYAFNSAHSYCVGNDGAEIAYTKAYYPYETYEVCLNWFDKKKNKEKVAALKDEMKQAFDINVGEIKFGLDNRKFTLDKENKCIHPSLTSIKGMGKNVADDIYKLSQEKIYINFYELMIDIKEKTSINTAMLDKLIKLDYFKEYGSIKKLLKFVEYFDILHGKKAPKKKTIGEKIKDENIINLISKYSSPTAATYTKFKSENCLLEVLKNIPNEDLKIQEKIVLNKEILGYLDYRNEELNKRFVFINELNLKYTPVVYTYCLFNGNTCKCKISKKLFKNKVLKENDIIYIN